MLKVFKQGVSLLEDVEAALAQDEHGHFPPMAVRISQALLSYCVNGALDVEVKFWPPGMPQKSQTLLVPATIDAQSQQVDQNLLEKVQGMAKRVPKNTSFSPSSDFRLWGELTFADVPGIDTEDFMATYSNAVPTCSEEYMDCEIKQEIDEDVIRQNQLKDFNIVLEDCTTLLDGKTSISSKGFAKGAGKGSKNKGRPKAKQSVPQLPKATRATAAKKSCEPESAPKKPQLIATPPAASAAQKNQRRGSIVSETVFSDSPRRSSGRKRILTARMKEAIRMDKTLSKSSAREFDDDLDPDFDIKTEKDDSIKQESEDESEDEEIAIVSQKAPKRSDKKPSCSPKRSDKKPSAQEKGSKTSAVKTPVRKSVVRTDMQDAAASESSSSCSKKTGQPQFYCIYCNDAEAMVENLVDAKVAFPRRSLMREHIQAKHVISNKGKQTLPCPLCEHETGTENTDPKSMANRMLRHVLAEHNVCYTETQLPGEEPMFYCFYCVKAENIKSRDVPANKTFSSKGALSRHIQKEHVQGSKYDCYLPCDFCEYEPHSLKTNVTRMVNWMMIHVVKRHRLPFSSITYISEKEEDAEVLVMPSRKEKVFLCFYCNSAEDFDSGKAFDGCEFLTGSAMSKHIEENHVEGEEGNHELPCPKCPFTPRTKKSHLNRMVNWMISHMMESHNLKFWQTSNTVVPTGTPEHSCPYCEKDSAGNQSSFSGKLHLHKHMAADHFKEEDGHLSLTCTDCPHCLQVEDDNQHELCAEMLVHIRQVHKNSKPSEQAESSSEKSAGSGSAVPDGRKSSDMALEYICMFCNDPSGMMFSLEHITDGVFSTRTSLYDHIRDNHCEVVEGEISFRCPLCAGKEFICREKWMAGMMRRALQHLSTDHLLEYIRPSMGVAKIRKRTFAEIRLEDDVNSGDPTSPAAKVARLITDIQIPMNPEVKAVNGDVQHSENGASSSASVKPKTIKCDLAKTAPTDGTKHSYLCAVCAQSGQAGQAVEVPVFPVFSELRDHILEKHAWRSGEKCFTECVICKRQFHTLKGQKQGMAVRLLKHMAESHNVHYLAKHLDGASDNGTVKPKTEQKVSEAAAEPAVSPAEVEEEELDLDSSDEEDDDVEDHVWVCVICKDAKESNGRLRKHIVEEHLPFMEGVSQELGCPMCSWKSGSAETEEELETCASHFINHCVLNHNLLSKGFNMADDLAAATLESLSADQSETPETVASAEEAKVEVNISDPSGEGIKTELPESIVVTKGEESTLAESLPSADEEKTTITESVPSVEGENKITKSVASTEGEESTLAESLPSADEEKTLITESVPSVEGENKSTKSVASTEGDESTLAESLPSADEEKTTTEGEESTITESVPSVKGYETEVNESVTTSEEQNITIRESLPLTTTLSNACFICNSGEYANISCLTEHVLATHMRTEGDDLTSLECPVCQHTYMRPKVDNTEPGKLECLVELLITHLMKRHAYQRSANTPVHACELCGYETLVQARLQNHKAAHKEEGGNTVEVKQEWIEKANSSRTEEGLYKCGRCYSKFAEMFKWRRHVLKHEEQGNICAHCGYFFKNKHYLQTHCWRVHKLNVTSRELVHCEVCNEEMVWTMVSHHRRNHQENKRKYECLVCGADCIGRDEYKKHKQTAHTQDGWHFCPNCDFKTKNLNYLPKHQILVHGNKEAFTCKLCGQFAPNRDRLAEHMHKKHPEGIIINYCSLCSKQLSSKIAYENHMFVTHKINLSNRLVLTCRICSFRTLGKSLMKAHLSNHSQQIIKCEICDHVSNSRAVYNAHKKRVHGNKRFKCNLCNHQSPDRSSLLKHISTKHTQEVHKSKCEYCPYITISQERLRKHQKAIHNIGIQQESRVLSALMNEGSEALKVGMPVEIEMVNTATDEEDLADHMTVYEDKADFEAQQEDLVAHALSEMANQAVETLEEIDSKDFTVELANTDIAVQALSEMAGTQMVSDSQMMEVTGNQVVELTGNRVVEVTGNNQVVELNSNRVVEVAGNNQVVELNGTQVVDVSSNQVVELNANQVVQMSGNQVVHLNDSQIVDFADGEVANTQIVELGGKKYEVANGQLVEIAGSQAVEVADNQMQMAGEPAAVAGQDSEQLIVYSDSVEGAGGQETLVIQGEGGFQEDLVLQGENGEQIQYESIQTYEQDGVSYMYVTLKEGDDQQVG